MDIALYTHYTIIFSYHFFIIFWGLSILIFNIVKMIVMRMLINYLVYSFYLLYL